MDDEKAGKMNDHDVYVEHHTKLTWISHLDFFVNILEFGSSALPTAKLLYFGSKNPSEFSRKSK